MTDNVYIHPTAIVEDGVELGEGSKVWHYAHIREGARLGAGCIVGKGVYIDEGVHIGARTKIQNHVSIFKGVTIEEGVFIGPHVCFTNDLLPRAIDPLGSLKTVEDWDPLETVVEFGASIGANSTIVCGIRVGAWAMVGAGSVVTRTVPPQTLVAGNPARKIAMVDREGKATYRKDRVDWMRVSRVSFVVPAHNEEGVLDSLVEKLNAALPGRVNAAVFIIDNGSMDGSPAVLERILKKSREGDGVVKFNCESIPEKGMGFAYRRGVSLALDQFEGASDHWILLTAADLPFNFSDLDRFLDLEGKETPHVVIGSKAHAESEVSVSKLRRFLSFSFRIVRRLVLGLKTKDTQGTVFVRSDVAEILCSQVRARDFFYSTELIAIAESLGYLVREVPIVYPPEQGRTSSVRPIQTSWAMLKSVFGLRSRLKKLRRG